MSPSLPLRSPQLRHALRTPLNHISGYGDMLIEDLSSEAPADLRESLIAVRESGRAILEVLKEELPEGDIEIETQNLERLRGRIKEPLRAITARVGQLAADQRTRDAGLNLADILRIASATAELVDFAAGTGAMKTAAEPPRSVRVGTAAEARGDVLVVDDNAGNRDLLARMLERQGYTVVMCESGEGALSLLAGREFDLILLDLMMPGLDGIGVLNRLRGDARLRAVPVIMLSALDETARVIQCLEVGAEDYVVKPFDPVLLLARLRSTLERSRLRAVEVTRARELEAAYGQLRENERRLQESEERLRLATDAAEVGIWYYYPIQDRFLMTPGCKRLFGLPPNDDPLTFQAVRERIHPLDRDRSDFAAKRAIGDLGEYDFEYRVVWPDGSVRWLSARGLAQRHGEARELRLAGVLLDITARKQAEEAALQAHKLESIGMLAGGIAHDFNNLLTGIIGSATFVIDNLPEDDINAEMLRNVINAGERASDLTRQLLAYSGKGKFAVHKLDLTKLVNEIAALLRTSIPRSVAIEWDLAESLPKVQADASQVQQILMNLVINGAEAIKDTGVVRISTGTATIEPGDRQDLVLGEDVPAGEYVFLEVCDNGGGIERELLGKIFEPFFTTKFMGRGLGLAAVFGIVRSHEGALEVRTAPGSGSTFRVYLPPAPGERVNRKEEAGAPTVLFVDEESVVRQLGRAALEHAGFRVLLGATGEDAMSTLRKHRGEIQVVVLDLTMAGLGGLATYRNMKNIDNTVEIIVSSGYSESEVRARYSEREIHSVLMKPYSASDLVAKVKDALGKRAAAAV